MKWILTVDFVLCLLCNEVDVSSSKCWAKAAIDFELEFGWFSAMETSPVPVEPSKFVGESFGSCTSAFAWISRLRFSCIGLICCWADVTCESDGSPTSICSLFTNPLDVEQICLNHKSENKLLKRLETKTNYHLLSLHRLVYAAQNIFEFRYSYCQNICLCRY